MTCIFFITLFWFLLYPRPSSGCRSPRRIVAATPQAIGR
uniref:Competence protein n=1 Tax=Siphoviridae sp. ct13O11 TaxID=2825303 RepID=A0A8S5UDD2_9CAUD|nr:MAG TPA: competence protein [Siphoviridae sp. ct13O11]